MYFLFLILLLSFSWISPSCGLANSLSRQEIAEKLVSFGLVTGYEDGSLRLERQITRAEVATIFTRLLHLDSKSLSSNPFSDIQNHWAKNNILLIHEQALVNGFEDGSFRPDKPISNTEILAIISRVLSLEDTIDSSLSWPDNYLSFGKELGWIDQGDVSHIATRGEVFQILYFALSYPIQ